VKDIDFCTYISVDNELGKHDYQHGCVTQAQPTLMPVCMGGISKLFRGNAWFPITSGSPMWWERYKLTNIHVCYTYTLHFISTFAHNFYNWACLLTSLPCVSLWTILCYQGDRGPGACTTDIPADQVKFLPYWPASVVAWPIDTGVCHRWIV